MNRTAAHSFVLGSALLALSGCIAPTATSDETGESQEALLSAVPTASLANDLAPATVVDKSASVLTTASPAISVAPRPVPPLFTFKDAKECAPYDVYTSALAEFTIACTGTIGPDSFAVRGGVLTRNFDKCVERKGVLLAATIEDIDDLLNLQHPVFEKDLVRNPDGSFPWSIRKCFVEPWIQWTQWLADRFAITNNASCPSWYQLVVDPTSDARTFDNAAEFGKTFPRADEKHIIQVKPEAALNFHMPKENYYYVVRFPAVPVGVAQPPTPRCETPELCGNACSTGLAGFYLDTKKVQVQIPPADGSKLNSRGATYTGPVIVGDPLWWLDPVVYAVDTSPYLAPDFYHPMSFYRALPGARYAHKNRAGEKCSYYCYDSNYHMIGQLVPDCVDPTNTATCTMTHCDPLPSTAPGPESGAGSL
jgi:hypothetical protein